MEERRTTTAMAGTKKVDEDYRNPWLSVDRRVDDLLGRMTLAGKAGMLFQTMIVVGSGDLAEPNSAFGIESAEQMINNQQLGHFENVGAAARAGTFSQFGAPAVAGEVHPRAFRRPVP